MPKTATASFVIAASDTVGMQAKDGIMHEALLAKFSSSHQGSHRCPKSQANQLRLLVLLNSRVTVVDMAVGALPAAVTDVAANSTLSGLTIVESRARCVGTATGNAGYLRKIPPPK
jgi:hypothetical protein